MRMAIVLIFLVALVCTLALFYEGEYGTEAVQQVVYRAWWFNLLLGLLGANILGAMVVRYPWPKKLSGFVVAHVGLIVLLVGSFVTRFGGMEGQMILAEGESSNQLLVDGSEFSLNLPDRSQRKLVADGVPGWAKDGPQVIEGTPYAFKVLEYLKTSRRINNVEPSEDGGEPALKVHMHGEGLGHHDKWLWPQDRARASQDLGPLKIQTLWLDSQATVDSFSAPQPVEDKGGADPLGTVVVRAPGGQSWRVPVTAWRGKVFDLDSGATLVLDKVIDNASVVQEDGKWVVRASPENRGAGPAVLAHIEAPGGRQEHAAFARFPEMASRRGSHSSEQEVAAGYQLIYERSDHAKNTNNTVSVGVTPQGAMFISFHKKGEATAGKAQPVKVGDEVPMPWMDFAIKIESWLPKAQRVQAIVAGEETDHPMPAARLRWTGPGGEVEGWVRYGEQSRVMHPSGPIVCAWQQRHVGLDFSIKLLDFRKLNNPGTTRAAAFESDVEVSTALGEQYETTISMNNPLQRGGHWYLPGTALTFYQSSYIQNPGQPEVSIFSVAYDPGFPLSMLGSLLIVLGVIMLFYIVPYFDPELPPSQERVSL